MAIMNSLSTPDACILGFRSSGTRRDCPCCDCPCQLVCAHAGTVDVSLCVHAVRVDVIFCVCILCVLMSACVCTCCTNRSVHAFMNTRRASASARFIFVMQRRHDACLPTCVCVSISILPSVCTKFTVTLFGAVEPPAKKPKLDTGLESEFMCDLMANIAHYLLYGCMIC